MKETPKLDYCKKVSDCTTVSRQVKIKKVLKFCFTKFLELPK